MARPTLATHPKFAVLSALLGGRGPARGHLELMWDAAYASGDPVIGDSVMLEAVVDWRGEPGALTAAMVRARFVDENPDGKLSVHDLEDHAPDYVLKRWERESNRRANGDTMRSVRQKAAHARWMQTNANGKQLHANGEHLSRGVSPPAPAPAPAPNTDPDQKGTRPLANARSLSPRGGPKPYPEAFEAVWKAVGEVGHLGNSIKGEAFTAWNAIGAPADAWQIQARWAAYVASLPEYQTTPKHFGRWLKARGHEQDYESHIVDLVAKAEAKQKRADDELRAGIEAERRKEARR